MSPLAVFAGPGQIPPSSSVLSSPITNHHQSCAWACTSDGPEPEWCQSSPSPPPRRLWWCLVDWIQPFTKPPPSANMPCRRRPEKDTFSYLPASTCLCRVLVSLYWAGVKNMLITLRHTGMTCWVKFTTKLQTTLTSLLNGCDIISLTSFLHTDSIRGPWWAWLVVSRY